MRQGSRALGSILVAGYYRTQEEGFCSVKKQCERKGRKLRKRLTCGFSFLSEAEGKVIF